MTRLLVVEPGYCPYQAGFPSAMAAASEVIEGESQILKPFGTPRIGLICSKSQSQLKYNRQVNDEGVTVRGRFLVCGLNGDKVIGLSKDQADRYSPKTSATETNCHFGKGWNDNARERR